MSRPSRARWFKGIADGDGDRTLAQQLKGLEPALAAAAGKTVLDLGAAEGLISREFAMRGAQAVVGLEILPDHVRIAGELCAGLPCHFEVCDLNEGIPDFCGEHRQADVVLALAIVHKLKKPCEALASFADLARELFVIRMPAFSKPGGLAFVSERYGRELVDVAQILGGRGFVLERLERGPTAEHGRQEPVLYFRRRA